MKNKIMKDSSGQSSVEFILSFIMVIGFVFMYIKVALNFTNGYVVHYANFMSSRAFMVYEGESNTVGGGDTGAVQIAKRAWDSYGIESVINNASIVRTQNMPGVVGNNVYVGVIATFQDRFSIFSNVGSTDFLEFKSESFLGREVNLAECVELICESFGELGVSCNNNTTVMDNGC